MVLLAALACVRSPAAGQEAASLPPPTVHPDGSVTFRRAAPDAGAVLLFLEGATPAPMTRGDEGVWTLTTEPLEANLYAYYFRIDGMPAADPANPAVLPMMGGGGQGLIHVPGPDSLFWERGDEARGTVEPLEYDSDVIGESRRALVYLPPGYRSDSGDGYPVLYLLHGVMSDETAWTTAGLADVILDNLLAEGRLAEPMIVVMPLGYGFPDADERAEGLMRTFEHREWIDTFRESMMTEVLPLAEARYPIRTDPESRAIAGLSMGGAQALYIGLSEPGTFGWVGSMSGAFMMYAGKLDAWLGQANEIPPADLPNLWITTGTDDFVLGANRMVADWLEENGIPADYQETTGGHTWLVWRTALAQFAPRLFRR